MELRRVFLISLVIKAFIETIGFHILIPANI